MRPAGFFRFVFSDQDQTLIDVASVKVEDELYSAAPDPTQSYPQAMRLSFKLTDPTKIPQIRPLFPGAMTFIVDENARQYLPQPRQTLELNEQTYNDWENHGVTHGAIMIKLVNLEIRREMQKLLLEVKPNVMWYSPVHLSKDFLFNSIPNGLQKGKVLGPPGIDREIAMDSPDWPKYAVAEFLAGIYEQNLRLHATDPSQDDVVKYAMPTVKTTMGNALVTLDVSMALAKDPQDGENVEFESLAMKLYPSKGVPDSHPAHPRNGAIPARYVYRQLKPMMIDAAGTIPNKVLADWPNAPRYFALRFTRTWKPIENCSIFFPAQKVMVEKAEPGRPLLFEQRLPAHGVIYLSQDQSGEPPGIVVSISSVAGGEEMRYLDGAIQDSWRQKAGTSPLQFELDTTPSPHIVLRRRMRSEMLADERRPNPGGGRCTYLSLRRAVRALIDHRITGGRLNAEVRNRINRRDRSRNSSETKKLINDAWVLLPTSVVKEFKDELHKIERDRPRQRPAGSLTPADIVLNDSPNPWKDDPLLDDDADTARKVATLIPILSAFYPDAVLPPDDFNKGQMAYDLWQSRADKFQGQDTRRYFDDMYIGRGGPGALKAVGLGHDYHFNPDQRQDEQPDDYLQRIASEMTNVFNELKPGAILQFWRSQSDYELIKDRDVPGDPPELPKPRSQHYGHSPVFLGYQFDAGVVSGIWVIDQFGEGTCPLQRTADGKPYRIKWDRVNGPEEIWIAADWEE